MTTNGQPWESHISTITILENKVRKRLFLSVICLMIAVCFSSCANKVENVSHDILLQNFNDRFDYISEVIAVIGSKCHEIEKLVPDGSADYQLFVSGSSHNDLTEMRNVFSDVEWGMMQNLFSELQSYSEITVSCYFWGVDEYAIKLLFWGVDNNGYYLPHCLIYTPFGYPSTIMDYLMFKGDLCIPLEHQHWYKLVRAEPSIEIDRQ